MKDSHPQTLESPQQRKRRSMKPKAVFTVAQAGSEVQDRFLFNQRLIFVLLVGLGIATMWLAAYYLPPPKEALFGPLTGLSLFVLLLSIVAKVRNRTLHIIAFISGIALLGMVVGWWIEQNKNDLLNPTILIGFPLLGQLLNSFLFRRFSSAWIEFLANAPWFVAACAIVWFFPASELNLLVSGTISLLLVFAMLRAAPESLQLYQPNQSFYSACGIPSIAFINSFRRALTRF